MKLDLHHAALRLLAALTALAALPAPAANILWVSDASPGSATGGVFSGPGSNYTDSGFVTLLQNAGHNVSRFNSADGQAVLLTDAEIAAINTNDLVIIGRAAGSGAFQVGAGTGGGPGQGSNWNTRVTAPLICMSPYLVRTIAANRMGWFVGDVGPDDMPTVLTAINPASAATDYLFGGVAMIGANTAQVFDELIDRNTSVILGAPVTGGRILAQATFPREDNGTVVTANMIADWPAGTVVAGGSNVLAGYRMYLAGGSRESASAPNAIPLYTGRENLTATGEDIFLRAVRLALNNGTPPATNPDEPVSITRQPANASVGTGQSVTFSVTVAGAAPRTLQWQRDAGDGVTFTNIPDATTTFSGSSYTLSAVTAEDNNATFRVVANNPHNTVTSDSAVLTVVPDTTPPTLVSAGSLDGTSVAVCFSEPLDDSNGAVSDEFTYLINGSGEHVLEALLQPDGRTVIVTLSTPITGSFVVDLDPNAELYDRAGNALAADGRQTNGLVLGLTLAAVGALNPAPPTAFSCGLNAVQITAGGLDLASTADIFGFASRTVSGDFDARVRVASLTPSDRLESVAKAILTARASGDTGSAAVNVFVTPVTPADNNVSASVRVATGGSTNALGASLSPNGLPNAWLRLTRIGSAWTTYHGTDGANWTQLGSTNASLPDELLVGLGVASHRNGRTITAAFENFQVTRIPTLTDAAFNAGVFSASFPTESGRTYRVLYSDSFPASSWTTLITLPGDGSTLPFSDPGPLSPTGTRFYRVAVD